ncbi:MAG: LemA family protein [Phycisphaerales bacterium]|jgi:LemA protein|nr:LemA family protein [Phycisphaerales bacterium]
MTLGFLVNGLGIMFLVIIGVVVLLALVVGVLMVSVYNNLVSRSVGFKNAYSQIDIQLKRRYDLIPNLVEVAKGYVKHERETLEAVIKARNGAVAAAGQAAANVGTASAMTALAGAEGVLSQTLGRLFALSEAYPDLKANTTIMQLSEELTSTENRVAFARQAYNDSVAGYNTYKRSFPPVVFAGLFGHGQDASLLTFDEGAKLQTAPVVKF